MRHIICIALAATIAGPAMAADLGPTPPRFTSRLTPQLTSPATTGRGFTSAAMWGRLGDR